MIYHHNKRHQEKMPPPTIPPYHNTTTPKAIVSKYHHHKYHCTKIPQHKIPTVKYATILIKATGITYDLHYTSTINFRMCMKMSFFQIATFIKLLTHHLIIIIVFSTFLTSGGHLLCQKLDNWLDRMCVFKHFWQASAAGHNI